MGRVLLNCAAAVSLTVLAAGSALAQEAEAASPATNPGSWVTTSDYPAWALREDLEGVVRFELAVAADGTPTQCTVTETSGSIRLDDHTCEKLLQRARFRPATNAAGEAVIGSFASAVRWTIPEGGPLVVPEPGTMRITLVVEADGSVSSCEVDGSRAEEARDAVCQSQQSFSPPVDGEGAPRRVRVITSVDVEVEELPLEP